MPATDPWAHLAERYEEAYGPKDDSPCTPRAREFARLVDGPIIDLACGPGFELARFAHGVGIDSSQAMLAAARTRAPSAHLVLGDVRHLPLKSSTLAAAFSCLALIHLTKAEFAGVLSQLRGLLRLGAPVSMIFFEGTGERDTTFSPFDSATAHYAFYRPLELVLMFENAGFVDVNVERDLLQEPHARPAPCLCVTAVNPGL
ncbi:MAG: class I SAM-dependent methyltransferase [Dehalococcoidia bacterium]